MTETEKLFDTFDAIKEETARLAEMKLLKRIYNNSDKEIKKIFKQYEEIDKTINPNPNTIDIKKITKLNRLLGRIDERQRLQKQLLKIYREKTKKSKILTSKKEGKT